MSLEDVYNKQVKGTGTISSLPTYGNPPIIERDPNVRRLEEDVFRQLASVIPPEPVAPEVPKLEIKSISFEEALKELASMNK
jgi:hypothetical protein